MVDNPAQDKSPRVRRNERLEAVVAAFETPLLRYAARLLRNTVMAQDVVQNAFIKLFRQWPEGMQADARLKAWLYRVTHNEAVDLIRAEERRRRHHDLRAADAAIGCPDGVHCDPQPDERVALVMRSLDTLSLPERQVILLRLQEGLSYAEIAVVTGRSSGYVGTLLHQAVRKLAATIQKQEGV